MASQVSSNSDQYQDVWKQIWGCKVPTKVQNLVWKACINALPIKSNIVHRRVLTDNVCEHCKQFPKDVCHTVWLCPGISAV